MDNSEENQRWLTLLPLFQTDHWPCVSDQTRHLNPWSPWETCCLCGDSDRSLFPYARYGSMSALFQGLGQQMREIDHLAEQQEGSWLNRAETRDSIVSSRCQDWPVMYFDMMNRDRFECPRGIHSDPTTAFLYFDRNETIAEHCDCAYDPPDLYISSSMEVSEDDSDDDILGIHAIIIPISFGDENYGLFPSEPPTRLISEDVSQHAVPGTYVRSFEEPQKRYRINHADVWEFTVTGSSWEADEPPPYESVSDLPSYEQAIKSTGAVAKTRRY